MSSSVCSRVSQRALSMQGNASATALRAISIAKIA